MGASAGILALTLSYINLNRQLAQSEGGEEQPQATTRSATEEAEEDFMGNSGMLDLTGDKVKEVL